MEIINYETAEINERLARVDTLESRVSGLTGLKFVNSTAEMTDTTRTYVNAADGNWYEYSGGSWVPRGQYGGVQVDAELETEGAAADAKATGAAVGELKSAIQAKCEVYKNLFDASKITDADGWTFSTNEYSGTALDINRKYGTAATAYPISGILPNKQYVIQFDGRTDGNGGTTGNGLRLQVNYSDGTNDRAQLMNSQTIYAHVKLFTSPTKSISYITFGYGTAGDNIWHLKNIMISEPDVLVDWMPHEIPVDYHARADIANLEGSISPIGNLSEKLSAPMLPVSVPVGFSWTDNPLVGKIKSNYLGEYVIDYDVADVEDVINTGTTYYVSPTGQNSNDGLTPDTPKRTLTSAYGSSNCTCIILMDGIYSNSQNFNKTIIDRDLAIKAYKDAKPIICTHSASTFAQYNGATYSATRGSCARVLDVSAPMNQYGDFYEYTKMSTVQEVIDTPGSWVHDNGVLYVHCYDGRVPDGGLLLLTNTPNLYVSGSNRVYLEGLTVISGRTPLQAVSPAQNTAPKIYAKNCSFLYSESTEYDVVMMQGVELSVFQNCRAMYGQKDGFNYHAKNGVICKAVEINCIGGMCGNIEDSNDQGSTIHDGGNIIRIRGTYFENYGSNLGDEASEAWNIGCVMFKSNAVSNEYQRANYIAYSGTKAWFDSCAMFGNAWRNIVGAADGTSTVFLRNCRTERGQN